METSCSAFRLTKKQQVWLGFVLTGILLTNSITGRLTVGKVYKAMLLGH
ncbi:MAG: hypothetical protein AAF806_22635 [Bacteroidota bacterium]